jgi:hypothetical protein
MTTPETYEQLLKRLTEGIDEYGYTFADYRRMLTNVIDANYGTSWHHIGDGDGMPPDAAAELAGFWREHLQRVQDAYNKGRNR